MHAPGGPMWIGSIRPDLLEDETTLVLVIIPVNFSP